MKIYKTQKEVEKDIKDGVLIINDDVKFECSISIKASINARDINARNINAWNINARDINAWNINAEDILYYAFCCVYNSIKCLSIKAKRTTCKEPTCLDGEIIIKDKETEEITVEEKNAIKILKYNGYEIIKK